MIANQPSVVDPTAVQSLLNEGFTLLDVRTSQEWAEAHIPGAVHLPMDQIVARLDEIPDQVVCVCAVGARSARVAQYLLAQGREAVNLDGGIYAWADAGLPLEADSF